MKLLYGSQNFGYDTPQSDRDWLQFMYPRWIDIVRNNQVSMETHNLDGSITKIKDIRLIPKMIEKANFSDLQFLYAQETYGCDDLKWFFENRDRLVRANLSQMYNTNRGYIISCINRRTRKDMVRALCFLELIKRALSEEEFVMRVDWLQDCRVKEDFYVNRNYIESELDRLKPMVANTEKDTMLLQEVEEEITRLLKKKLYNN